MVSLRQSCSLRSALSRALPTKASNFSCETRIRSSKSAAIAQNWRRKRTDSGCDVESAIRSQPGETDGPRGLQACKAGLAPKPFLATDVFARGGGVGIGQRAKPSRVADDAGRSGQFAWYVAAAGATACRVRFLSLSLAEISGRENSDRRAAASTRGFRVQHVGSSCRTRTDAPSEPFCAIAGPDDGGVILSSS